MSGGSTKRKQPETASGLQLYQLIPAVYRNRDNATETEAGDLGRYFDALGDVLDRIRGTLEQRLADSFPDNPREGRACQPWLLPYLAQLLDVRLVSPETEGRREEVANAVSWRQCKGTLACVEDIAEKVGQMEVEVQEGWKRVAVTPRIGEPLLPASVYGVEAGSEMAQKIVSRPALHPGLPAATVDVRNPSRAVLADEGNPAVHRSKFGGEEDVFWRQDNLHGAPCFPGSFEDVSPRTVDMRTPDWHRGHYHPKNLLLFAPPPHGFFEPGWQTRGPEHAVVADVTLAHDDGHVLEDIIIQGTLTVNDAAVTLRNCAVEELIVDFGAGADERVLLAESCLFRRVKVATGVAQLEYCTVLEDASFFRVNASDCIFGEGPALTATEPEGLSCIRYSRIGPDVPRSKLSLYEGAPDTNSTAHPVYYPFEICVDVGGGKLEKQRKPAAFGESGCGVLHPAAPRAISAGAEDGGEMGAYHERHYSLRFEAVLDKVKDFLPVGIQAALVPDSRLHKAVQVQE